MRNPNPNLIDQIKDAALKLLMEKDPSQIGMRDITPAQMEEFYVCNKTGEKLLREAIKRGQAKSSNPRFDVSLLVSGLWGCIESVLLKKCEVEYWDNGVAYTDRFIKMWCKSLFLEDCE